MEIKYRSNLAGGIAGIVIGLILIMIIPQQIGADLIKTDYVTSRTVPYIASAAFALCGVALVFQSLVLKKDEIKTLNLQREGKTLLYILCLGIYAVALKYSFLICTSLLVIITLLFSNCKKKSYYVIAVVAVIILYLIFKEVLHIRLP